MKIKEDKIQSIHFINGKKIIVLKSVDTLFKPKKKNKAKNYFSKLKNSK